MSLILSLLMTLWVTYINLGFTASFFNDWRLAFMYAWPVAWIVSFLFGPLVTQLTLKIVPVSD
ncbi:DUF2798 domain-containing protein [Alteromonas sp. KUL49]|uniref:DUF2798 domain-containing protein n=1 Tax=Alteromonas sp. KUL49 TaxID=2480798 RepID=UPI00215AE9EE|nr:DUF2798 domain-containing protein [Alteromonas sp. KUL49]